MFELRIDWLLGCTRVSISFTTSGMPFSFSRKPRYRNEISYRSRCKRSHDIEGDCDGDGGGGGKNNNPLSMPYVSAKNANVATRARRPRRYAPAVATVKSAPMALIYMRATGSTVRSMIYKCRDDGKWRSRGNCGEERFPPAGRGSGGADRLIN